MQKSEDKNFPLVKCFFLIVRLIVWCILVLNIIFWNVPRQKKIDESRKQVKITFIVNVKGISILMHNLFFVLFIYTNLIRISVQFITECVADPYTHTNVYNGAFQPLTLSSISNETPNSKPFQLKYLMDEQYYFYFCVYVPV